MLIGASYHINKTNIKFNNISTQPNDQCSHTCVFVLTKACTLRSLKKKERVDIKIHYSILTQDNGRSTKYEINLK